MRRIMLLLAVLASSAHGAGAGVRIDIDKATQRMNVSVNGVPAYAWRVSTGRGGYGTPAGRYHPRWMARSWFSTRYYGSPMPHAIFFHRGYAIHGTNYISRLGGPASHGCVRLHPANAAVLYRLVQQAGMANTSIVISSGHPLAHRRHGS